MQIGSIGRAVDGFALNTPTACPQRDSRLAFVYGNGDNRLATYTMA